MTDFSLLVSLISDLGDYLMSQKIDNSDLVLSSFQDHQVEVVPLLTIFGVGSGKWANSAVMLIFLCDSTVHTAILPQVDTLSDVSLVLGVLEVVDQQFLPVLL